MFIYIENNKPLIFMYNLSNGNITEFYNGTVDLNSKPIITSNGEIIFVSNGATAKVEERTESSSTTIVTFPEDYRIKIYDGTGSVTDVIQGRFPILINEGKDLIYYNFRSLHLYNMISKKDRIIKKTVSILETPAVSPHEDFIAFYEVDKTVNIGAEASEFLSVMTINVKHKKHIEAFNNSKRILDVNGVTWLD